MERSKEDQIAQPTLADIPDTEPTADLQKHLAKTLKATETIIFPPAACCLLEHPDIKALFEKLQIDTAILGHINCSGENAHIGLINFINILIHAFEKFLYAHSGPSPFLLTNQDLREEAEKIATQWHTKTPNHISYIVQTLEEAKQELLLKE